MNKNGPALSFASSLAFFKSSRKNTWDLMRRPCGDYRTFAADLSNEFDDVCNDRITKEPKALRMTLANIAYAERIRLTPTEYLEKHVQFRKDKAK